VIKDKAILIVDDSSTMRRILQLSLNKCGYGTIEEAASGKEAPGTAPVHHFDCIITDWNTPEMDGIELARCLRDIGRPEEPQAASLEHQDEDTRTSKRKTPPVAEEINS